MIEAKVVTYDDNNVFAQILRGELPCHKVYETDTILAFMDVMPRSDGHVLIIPKAKARTILDINEDDLADTILAAQIISKAATRAFAADGITIIQSNERAGGQVIFHFHIHVIPRRDGVELKPHSGTMERAEVLADNATMIRDAVAAMTR